MQKQSPQLVDFRNLKVQIISWAHELGFQSVGICNTELSDAEDRLMEWLSLGMHGEMDYMANHGTKRSRPDELVPGTIRVISLGMNYLPVNVRDSWDVIADGGSAFISRYALGRDYHKVMRKRLALLADRISNVAVQFDGRVFVDSAPVMEVELAGKAGIGWRGKHNLMLSREHGSWFFLGEIYLNLPLPVDSERSAHCGTCSRCIDLCPTKAIIAPYQLDARRCISYLTIEFKGSIPIEFRTLIGNRIYGCDDCQLVCPWNGSRSRAVEPDFSVRNGMDDIALAELFAWDENDFKEKFAGSPIFRIGYLQWLRNIAVALGNAPRSDSVLAALQSRLKHESGLVREHTEWALMQHASK